MTEFRAEPVATTNHTALRVRDMAESLAFYRDLIGLPVLRSQGPDDAPNAVWLPGLQLVRASDGEVPAPGGTLDHLALGFSNVEEVVERLVSAGHVPDIALETRERQGGSVVLAFFRDPDGNRVELLDYR
jgi:catechol 2,3-dioxygenase-like lactoylglutathione lyase family enzyme